MIFPHSGETAMCHVEKSSLPLGGRQREDSSFCTLFSATNTATVRKALSAHQPEMTPRSRVWIRMLGVQSRASSPQGT